MKSSGALCVLIIVLVFGVQAMSPQAVSKELSSDILGISIGMNEPDAHARLQKIGRLEKQERGAQEVWALSDDAQFAYLIVGFDKSGQVRYVTVKARDVGSGKQPRRLRYADVADIKKARQVIGSGNYEYIWEVAPSANRPAYNVIARGTDPQYLLYYSLKSAK